MWRQEFLYEFRPFDETGVGGVEIVVGADVYGFGEVFDAIEVEVVYGAFEEFAVILIDDGESGRIDHVFYAERFAEGFDESGFSCPHLSVECKNLCGIVRKMNRGNEFFCRRLDSV